MEEFNYKKMEEFLSLSKDVKLKKDIMEECIKRIQFCHKNLCNYKGNPIFNGDVFLKIEHHEYNYPPECYLYLKEKEYERGYLIIDLSFDGFSMNYKLDCQKDNYVGYVKVKQFMDKFPNSRSVFWELVKRGLLDTQKFDGILFVNSEYEEEEIKEKIKQLDMKKKNYTEEVGNPIGPS